MTRTEILRLAAGLAWAVALSMAVAERRILRRLRDASARSPDSAMPLAQWSPLVRFRLGRLVHSGAVVATDAGRYYLDHEGLARYRQLRRRRVVIVLAVLLPIAGVLWWFGSR